MVEQWGYTLPYGNTHLTANNAPVFQEYDFIYQDAASCSGSLFVDM